MGLSEKVLARIKKRRRSRLISIASGLCLTCVLAGEITLIHLEQVRVRKVNAPRWADFVPADKSEKNYEWVEGVDPKTGVPHLIVVNGEVWNIVRINRYSDVDPNLQGRVTNDKRSATTYCENKTIAFIETKNPDELRINLWHEVIHAGACLHGGDKWWNNPPTDRPQDEHPGVYHLGEFLFTFAKDNPLFIEYEAGK